MRRVSKSGVIVPLLAALIVFQAPAAEGTGRSEKDAAPAPIRDNSFLVEEAYNQEPGVIQHIGTYTRFNDSDEWFYTFTQEWPAPRMTHQLSFTVPFGRPPFGAADSSSGVGDVLLNYRYQWFGGGPERFSASPRASLILPTGDERAGRGSGAIGVEMNLPISIDLSQRIVSHSNLGIAYLPSAENESGEEADITRYFLGQGFIWLLRPRLNLMLEALWIDDEGITGPDRTERGSRFFLNPGLRAAFDFDSGLQIVPGIAFPIGIGGSSGEEGVFLYVSFEHPFRKVPDNAGR